MIRQTLLERLQSLQRHLDEEGWHVHSNTVTLAIKKLFTTEQVKMSPFQTRIEALATRLNNHNDAMAKFAFLNSKTRMPSFWATGNTAFAAVVNQKASIANAQDALGLGIKDTRPLDTLLPLNRVAFEALIKAYADAGRKIARGELVERVNAAEGL